MDEIEYNEIELNWRETVASGAGVSVTQSYIFKGKITKVMFHFPPGALALVDVKLEKDFLPFYPLTGFIALDDATPVYQTHVSYYAREPLTLTVQNRDNINEHTISCTVVIRFETPSW